MGCRLYTNAPDPTAHTRIATIDRDRPKPKQGRVQQGQDRLKAIRSSRSALSKVRRRTNVNIMPAAPEELACIVDQTRAAAAASLLRPAC